jgi:hypothetical protein
MAGSGPFGQPPHHVNAAWLAACWLAAQGVVPAPAVPWHHVPMAVSTPPVRRTSEYEFHDLLLPRGTSRGAARRMLTEHAEYGHWELATLRMFPDGTRKITLRRRILRMARTS